MNIYSLLRLYHRVKSPRLKLLGIMAMHVLRRRYLFIALDPSIACNLRCRLCYFSDPSKVHSLGRRFSEADLRAIAKATFHRGLKLQVGCGAEPTTSKLLPDIVRMGRESGIPTISMSTNGNLLTRELLTQLVADGLNELILSTHGFCASTYEKMMPGASFTRFTELLADISEVKREYPDLRLRVNYTMCADNIDDLPLLPRVFDSLTPDVIQLRPVQDIGSEAYDNYSVEAIAGNYSRCVSPVIEYCKDRGITCLYPQPENLTVIDSENQTGQHLNSAVDMLPHLYLAPYDGWKEQFDPYTETFESHSRRTGRVRHMLRLLFSSGKSDDSQDSKTRALNYEVT